MWRRNALPNTQKFQKIGENTEQNENKAGRCVPKKGKKLIIIIFMFSNILQIDKYLSQFLDPLGLFLDNFG